MALVECTTTVDESGRELLKHGSFEFPVACYEDNFQVTDVPWHWHEEWEAVLLSKGSCTVAAGSQKVLLTAGQGFFIPSGILHGCWDTLHSGCRFHSLVFHPRLIGGNPDSIFHQQYIKPLLAPKHTELVTLSPDVFWQKQALEAIEAAWQAITQEVPDYPLESRSALSRLAALLCRNLPPEQTIPIEKEQRDFQRIKVMLQLIHSEFENDLTIARIADCAAISESECLRCFRAIIGTPPIQYLKQYRIRQAASQLLETKDRISDIAVRCGFQDMSYFTRAFREKMGVTPSQYRKNASL